jgi:hypothetical protein
MVLEIASIPNNPLLFPRPKPVKCPKDKCGAVWHWRTWWRGKYKTTCPACKTKVVPKILSDGEVENVNTLLIKCSFCGGLQWYTGNKTKTTCTLCGKRNIKVIEVTYDELEQIIQERGYEDQEYYKERLEEMR